MNVRRKWRYLVPAAAGSLVWALSAGLPAAHAAGPTPATGTGALVTVGSPTGDHPENAQNEPALAVDPTNPNILAAGGHHGGGVLLPARDLQPRGGPGRGVLLV
jgi:hypothetical protein